MARLDALLIMADTARRAWIGGDRPGRARPEARIPTVLSEADRKKAAGLMRVNHVGEVCAQALYQAQSLATSNPALRRRYADAAREESDHLAWTRQRLDELGARPSWLNPLWYAGAFGLGLVAGRRGDAASLGFVVETERQVEQHLQSHLGALPAGDHASMAIVEQMALDERGHAESALRAGAVELPLMARAAMRLAAKIMTTTARYV